MEAWRSGALELWRLTAGVATWRYGGGLLRSADLEVDVATRKLGGLEEHCRSGDVNA
jgi:hypothetical protein